jgi:hypothetical protein
MAHNQNAECFKKNVLSGLDNDIAKRLLHVDVLRDIKEEKPFFNRVDCDPVYDPFGMPGSGAPLKTGAKLPKMQENLWRRYTIEGFDNNKDAQSKKQQVLSEIERFSRNNVYRQGDSQVVEKRAKYNLDSQYYWNDWWGRPGAGAPSSSYQRQNIYEMLEPNAPRLSYSQSSGQRSKRSNHYNRYELI